VENDMNIYYTAKDIEELVAKGVRQLELGPNASLTDFARETAEQLDLELIDITKGNQNEKLPKPSKAVVPSQSYNKPRGCQPDQAVPIAVRPQITNQSEESPDQERTTPVSRLVDMMGKIIKRGE
jgi:hypothetical protein